MLLSLLLAHAIVRDSSRHDGFPYPGLTACPPISADIGSTHETYTAKDNVTFDVSSTDMDGTNCDIPQVGATSYVDQSDRLDCVLNSLDSWDGFKTGPSADGKNTFTIYGRVASQPGWYIDTFTFSDEQIYGSPNWDLPVELTRVVLVNPGAADYVSTPPNIPVAPATSRLLAVQSFSNVLSYPYRKQLPFSLATALAAKLTAKQQQTLKVQNHVSLSLSRIDPTLRKDATVFISDRIAEVQTALGSTLTIDINRMSEFSIVLNGPPAHKPSVRGFTTDGKRITF